MQPRLGMSAGEKRSCEAEEPGSRSGSKMHALELQPLGPGLLFGLMLIAALIGGHIARSIHVPRVIGFLLGGVALRGLLYDLLASEEGGDVATNILVTAAQPLQVIKDLALGLILFMIGGVFERSRLKATSPRVLRIGLLEIVLTASLVFVGCLLGALLIQPLLGVKSNLALALLLGVAGIATAPAATLFVLQEYESKGPITETILGLTGLNNIVCIVAFHAAFLTLAACGLIEVRGFLAHHASLSLLVTVLGSFFLGVLCGFLISVCHGKLPLAETLLIFFALFIVLGAGEKWLLDRYGLSYNFLLTSLVLGGVFANVAIDGDKLLNSLRTIGSLIFAGFFVMAGYDLRLDDLIRMGGLGGIYVLARFLGKSLGCHLGLRWARAPERTKGRLGDAMLCQAAVVIGLASFVERNWASPELATQFSTVILGSVVVFELLGPILVKHRVVQGGEVKAVTLLSRPAAARASIFRVTLGSLLRLFGIGGATSTSRQDSMSVKHVMRTNVQFIPAASNLDDVLHFIERSTHSHFPVVGEDGTFIGMIHFSDIRDVIYEPTLRDLITAMDLVDPQSPTVPPDMSLNELFEVFTVHNVAVLPVTQKGDAGHVIGIVEQRDLLRALHLTRDSA
jgi:Kef-type K+ transport system membrane component KefB/CBS domain-containing protein